MEDPTNPSSFLLIPDLRQFLSGGADVGAVGAEVRAGGLHQVDPIELAFCDSYVASVMTVKFFRFIRTASK